jgi:hypothetical protein
MKPGKVEHVRLADHAMSRLKLPGEAVLDCLWSLPSLKPLTGGAISGLDVGQDS